MKQNSAAPNDRENMFPPPHRRHPRACFRQNKKRGWQRRARRKPARTRTAGKQAARKNPVGLISALHKRTKATKESTLLAGEPTRRRPENPWLRSRTNASGRVLPIGTTRPAMESTLQVLLRRGPCMGAHGGPADAKSKLANKELYCCDRHRC